MSALTYRRPRTTGNDALYRGRIAARTTTTASAALPSDTFNRSNAASLGTSSSGHTWDEHGTAWSISGNEAIPPSSAGYVVATLDAGVANVDLSVTVDPKGNGGDLGPVARVVDTNNFILFDIVWQTDHWLCRAFQRVSGSFSGLTTLVDPVTQLGSDKTTPFTARLQVIGSSGQVWIAGASQGTWSSLNSALLTATTHGLGANQAPDSGFDNLTMTAA